ncbi:MAG TPA: hypothetical protein PLK33_00150 [bacterium]|nr:hypothetical protein [bacterium]
MAEILSLDINPTSGKQGDMVTAVVKASPDTKSVYGRIPEYGYMLQFRKEGDVFKLSMQIPYGAPPGVYMVSVYPVDNEGNRGEEKKFNFQVL